MTSCSHRNVARASSLAKDEFSVSGQVRDRSEAYSTGTKDQIVGRIGVTDVGSDEIVNYIPALRIYARSLTRNLVDADDLVQETLVRGLANIHSYQRGSNMRAWLFTIMRNRFYTNCGKSAREPTGEADCVSSVPSGVNESQIWHLRRREIERALLDLPIHYREAILLVGVLGESYKDAADILGCDIGTIKSRVSRARTALSQVINAPIGE